MILSWLDGHQPEALTLVIGTSLTAWLDASRRQRSTGSRLPSLSGWSRSAGANLAAASSGRRRSTWAPCSTLTLSSGRSA